MVSGEPAHCFRARHSSGVRSEWRSFTSLSHHAVFRAQSGRRLFSPCWAGVLDGGNGSKQVAGTIESPDVKKVSFEESERLQNDDNSRIQACTHYHHYYRPKT